MARRRIGQERLSVGCEPVRGGTSLAKCRGCWTGRAGPLARGHLVIVQGRAGLAGAGAVSSPAAGDVARPLYVRLAELLDDRASFRRFCGFTAHEATPERTAFVRFRAELVRLWSRSPAVRNHHAPTRSARRRRAHGHVGGRDADPVGQHSEG